MNRIALACLALGLAGASAAPALDLIREGRPVATILLPRDPGPSEQAAADTIQRYLLLATGARLPAVKEPAEIQGAILSVGHTELARQAGLAQEDLVLDGYRLLAKGNVVFVFGRDLPFDPAKTSKWAGTRGTYRASFAFLKRLGFRWLAPGDKGTHIPDFPDKTVAAPDELDVTHRPAFAFSISRFDRYGDWSWANGFGTPAKIYLHGGHTWDVFVPAALWGEHPEYFAMDTHGQRVKPPGRNNMLCPTEPGVIALLAEGIRKKMDEGYEAVELGQSDGFWPCHCPRCRALGDGYESEQVHVGHAKVIEEVGRTHPDKFVLMTIYGPTKARSRLVKEYPPNTMFEICSSNEDTIKYWVPKAGGGATVYVYYFGIWQKRGLLPKQSPLRMANEVAKLNGLGVRGVYWCGGTENWAAEGPAYYAVGRATTDPGVSGAEALQEYCDGLYGKAAPVMVKYHRLLAGRLGRDDGELSLNEAISKNYPPDLVEKAAALLRQAGEMVRGDERAANWLRLAGYGFRQIQTMAAVVHLYNAYETNRTVENLQQVRQAVAAYRSFAEEVENLDVSDPAFVKDYFPNHRVWKKDTFTNAKQIGSPFKWDFETILASGLLPGRDRNSAVIPRAPRPPVLDGRLDDPVWQATPPIEVRDIALGRSEARTEMRLAFDDHALYAAFECAEPLMDKMKISDCKRDGPVWRTECVEIVLDPYAEGQKILHFIATPSETGIYDGRRGYIEDPLHPLVLANAEDASWDPEWRHAFALDKERKVWTLEIAIPFASLGVPPPRDGERWRGNFARERNRFHWGPEFKDAAQQVFLWSPNLQKVSIADETAAGDLYFGRKP